MLLAQSGIMGFQERIPTDIPYTTYTPTFAGFSASPTVVARYVNYGGLVHVWIQTTAHGTSNATAANSLTFTLPIASANTVAQNTVVSVTVNSGARSTVPGYCLITANSTTATVYRDSSAVTTWTGSGNKSFNLSIVYDAGTYETFAPSFAGFSANPTVTARYLRQFGRCHYYLSTSAHGTSNTTSSNSTTVSLPFQSANFIQRMPIAVITDNGSRQTGLGMMYVAANSSTGIVYRNPGEGTLWTGSGNKSFSFSVVYQTV
jgi:hypothetical protein